MLMPMVFNDLVMCPLDVLILGGGVFLLPRFAHRFEKVVEIGKSDVVDEAIRLDYFIILNIEDLSYDIVLHIVEPAFNLPSLLACQIDLLRITLEEIDKC